MRILKTLDTIRELELLSGGSFKDYVKITTEEEQENHDHISANFGRRNKDFLTTSNSNTYFKSVSALPEYQLEVIMETGTIIHFNFQSRLDTIRFGKLRDEEMFQSVRTDGTNMIFEKTGKVPLKITASEFMDLVLIDRRR